MTHRTKLVETTVPTSTGVQTISLGTGFGTPVGIMVCVAATTFDIDDTSTPTNGACLSVGAGVWELGVPTQWVAVVTARHSTIQSYRWMRSDSIGLVLRLSNGDVFCRGRLTSFGSDTVSLTWPTVDGTAYKMWVWAIAGEDVAMDVGHALTANVVGGTKNVVTKRAAIPRGFVALSQGSPQTVDAAAATSGPGRLCMGFGSWDGTTIRQVSGAVSWSSGGVPVATTTAVGASELYIGYVANTTGETDQTQFELTDVSSGQFEVTTRTQANEMPFLWACFYGVEAIADMFEMTSAGNASYAYPTGVSAFTPVGGILLNMLARTSDVESEGEGARGGGIGLGGIDKDGAEASAAINNERNAATANTQTIYDDVAVHIPAHGGGTGGLEAEWVSWDATGLTLNILNALAGTRIAPMLLMGEKIVVERTGAEESKAQAVQSGPVRASATQSGPVSGNAVQSGPTGAGATQSGPVSANAVQSGPTAAGAVESH